MNDLLPPNATRQERAITLSTARAFNVPFGRRWPDLVVTGPLAILGVPHTIPRLKYVGDFNGRPYWSATGGDDSFIMASWDAGYWKVEVDGSGNHWRVLSDAATPDLATGWETAGDATGLPTVELVAVDPPDVPDPDPIRPLWNPATCPLDLLPWLAWAFSVDVWNSNWSEEVKRAVVATSIETHRKKGTVGAVKGALAALGAGSALVEWWQKSPTGTPHTFTINLVSGDSSLEMQDAMAAAIDRTKPLRSHYDIVYGVATEGTINVVALFRPGVFVRLDGGATY